MGWWSEWINRRRQRRAAADAALARAEHERRCQQWQAELVAARERLEVAESFRGLERSEVDDLPVQLKRDERVYLIIEDAALVEPRRQPGQYQGGSQGFSVRVAKGLSYRVGGHRGTFQPGPEALTLIDEGVAVITNERMVFQGEKQTRLWEFRKLVGVDHDEGHTTVHVSNRQKASGIAYGTRHAADVRQRLDLAVADHFDTTDRLIEDAKGVLREIEVRRPQPFAGDTRA